jgi:hypothetical protein
VFVRTLLTSSRPIVAERGGVHSFGTSKLEFHRAKGMVQALKSHAVVLSLYLALPLCVCGQQQQSPPKDTSNSCRKFVEEFYSWYRTKTINDPVRDGGVALKERSYSFSLAIVQALREDIEAQVKAGSDLVSLDGDPFVGADGLAGNYIVEKVTVKNQSCWAEVHGVWEGKEDRNPDVIPELAIRNHKWRFVNFYFPTPSNPRGWDLLSALRALREGEKKQGAGKGRKQ